MVQLAAAGEPRFVVDDRELQRQGPSYTVDTLLSLRSELGEESLGLVIGMDAFLYLHTWHRWEQLIELAHFIVMQRPGHYSPVQYRKKMHADVRVLVEKRLVANAEELHNGACGKIWFQAVSQLDISATRIRAMIKDGHSVRYLTPEKVLEYIEKQPLYR